MKQLRNTHPEETMETPSSRIRVSYRILVFLLLTGAFLLLHEPLFDLWCGTGIGRLLGAVTPSLCNDGISMVLEVLGMVFGCMLPKRLSEEGNNWGRIIAGSLIVILLIQSFSFNDRFVHFLSIPWFRYTDSLIAFFVVFWIASRFRNKTSGASNTDQQEKSHHLFIDDADEVDFLGRERLLVDHLYGRLTEIKRNQKGAVGVAITGDWGTGKSWLMTQIQQRFEKNGEICVNFKPWLYGESDLTRTFYRTLESQLKGNGLKLEGLKQAIIEIDNEELVGLGRAFLSLFGTVTKSGGREKAIGRIKEELSSTNRQLYIFIDDCDRLEQKELLQVLSLIRNTGDFPGLVYLMAFDKEVVKTIIGEERGMSYVGKMFNLTIDLPPINDAILSDYLNESAREILGVEENTENPFKRIPITHYLPTVREAKKYLNLLSVDYARLKHRFDTYYYNEADFCLLELLKYKYSDVYYGIQSNPQAYLTFELKGWNSPAGVPQFTAFNNHDDFQLDLVDALFRVVSELKNPLDSIGVSNEEFFPLYFEKDLDRKYLERKELNEDIDKDSILFSIDGWFVGDYHGILGMICAASERMTGRSVFVSMLKYIWHSCEKAEPNYPRLESLSYGYEKNNLRHSFKHIMEVIARTPQIGMLTFQNLESVDGSNEMNPMNSMEFLIEETDYTLELMGIWLDELKRLNDTDYPYSEVRSYVEKLWGKLIIEVQDDNSLTLDVLDVLEACTLEDTFERMVLPLVTDNPQRWLGATIMIVMDGDKKYYLLKSRAIHALFGSLDKMYDEMAILEKAANQKDKEYVKAYLSLLYSLAAMTVNKKDSTIPNQYKHPVCIEVRAFKALSESLLLGDESLMPIKVAIKQIEEQPFWKGINLRGHREIGARVI